jgi:signal transduction histidine kinase
MENSALRVFYWLRLEGEARNLSPMLGQRIAQCLDAFLESLTSQDFAPTARFLAQEKDRVAELEGEEQILQTIALLDACERALAEELQSENNSNHSGDKVLLAAHTALHSLAHQSRRHWLHICMGHITESHEQGLADRLTALGRALNAARNLDQLVDSLFTGLQELIPHEDAQLLIWGRRQDPLVRCSSSHLFVGHGGAIDSYSNWVAFQRTPLLVPDLEAGPEHPDKPAYQSYIGIPLIQGDHLVGTLALVSTTSDAFIQAHLDLLVTIEPLLCAAIQRVVPETGPLEDLQRRLEEQNIILTFGREMSAALEEDRIFSLLLFKAIELTDSDAGAILTVESEWEEYTIQALSGYATDVTAEDALIASPTMSWNVGVVGWVARSSRPALIPNVHEAEDYLAVRPETSSQLAVPIRLRGATIGVISLESNSLNAYEEAHLKIVEMLADHAAVAIGTTRLYNEVQEKREWLASLVTNLPEGIVVTDEDLHIVLSNPASAHFLKLDRPLPEGVEIEQHLLAHLTPFLQDPQVLGNFLDRTRNLDRGLTEGWIEFKEASHRLWLVGAPLWGEGGRSSGRVILIRDARQEEDGEREKLGFISVVSHELRSPLTSILGYAELLQSRDFNREMRQEFLEIIFNQADHLSRLVNDLLNLSRLSRGRMQMNWSMTSFYQVVASLTTQLDGQMSDHHKLLLDVDENLPPFYMDRDKVRVVLNNLINNAVKYSPEGGEIILKAELITDPAQLPEVELPSPDLLILISVKDEGVGIPEEAIPHIFDRFYRVDNSVTRQIGGTGLGLTIAKALVELHGGVIWVKSKVDQGSAFNFTLPIRDRPPREEKESPFKFGEGGGYEKESSLR